MSSSQQPSHAAIHRTNPYLTPAYLINLSSHIQTLSSFFQQQSLPSLASQYKSFLQTTFKNLSNSLNVFAEDENMIVSSLLSTKVELEIFVGEKLVVLLEKEAQPLAEILKFVLQGYKKNCEDFDELLMRQRKRKVEFENQKNDRVINNLKKEVLIKREYVKELEQRNKDLQQQNSKIYQKIIDNAKHTISTTLIQTKTLTNSQQFLTPGKYSSIKPSHPNQSSPVQLKISHKQMSLKQVEQTILDIMSLKRKQQSISQKRSSMKSYIKYYFKYKFGLSELCEEMRSNFLAAVRHFLSSSWEREQGYGSMESLHGNGSAQQKPLLLMFQKMIDEQIDESYFFNEYVPKGIKIIKLFKRYLHQKQKVELKQLDRLYDGYEGISGSISNYSTNKIIFNEEQRKDFELNEADVKHILCNVYTKSKEIETLQMIFAEMIGKDVSQSDVWMGKEESSILMSRNRPQMSSRSTVFSKHLLGIILCYQIQSYSIKLTHLTNAIKKYSLSSQWAVINYMGLEKIILEIKIDQDKYLPYLQQNFQDLKDREFTYSEVVEIVDGQICGEKMDAKYFSGGQSFNMKKY